MKKLITLILVLSFALCAPAVTPVTWAASEASEIAQDNVVDKVGDWFATRGKTEAERKAILAQRKTDRVAKRAEKQAMKAKKRAEQETKKAQKDMKAKMKGFGKK